MTKYKKTVSDHAATQRAHDVTMMSYERRCDVMTSHRRRSDVILTSCACWVSFTEILLTFVTAETLKELGEYLIMPSGKHVRALNTPLNPTFI